MICVIVRVVSSLTSWRVIHLWMTLVSAIKSTNGSASLGLHGWSFTNSFMLYLCYFLRLRNFSNINLIFLLFLHFRGKCNVLVFCFSIGWMYSWMYLLHRVFDKNLFFFCYFTFFPLPTFCFFLLFLCFCFLFFCFSHLSSQVKRTIVVVWMESASRTWFVQRNVAVKAQWSTAPISSWPVFRHTSLNTPQTCESAASYSCLLTHTHTHSHAYRHKGSLIYASLSCLTKQYHESHFHFQVQHKNAFPTIFFIWNTLTCTDTHTHTPSPTHILLLLQYHKGILCVGVVHLLTIHWSSILILFKCGFFYGEGSSKINHKVFILNTTSVLPVKKKKKHIKHTIIE